MNKLNLGKDLYVKGRIGWRGLSKEEYLDKSDYRIINATALMDGYIDWTNCGYISKERFEESTEIILREGDILISKDGTLGKIGYVRNLTVPCTVASGIFVLRNTISNKLNFDYLYHILKSYIFRDFINKNKALGSTINHLYQRELEKFEIVLPELQIQNKISNLLNIIEIRISNNYKINSELNDIIQLYIDFAFNQGMFLQESKTKLEQVVNRVKVGFVGTIEEFYCEKEKGIPIIRTTDITDIGIDYRNLKYVTRDFHNKNKKSQLKQENLVIARHGDSGKTNIYEENFEAQVLNAIIIEPNNKIINPYLLKYLLQMPFVQKQMKMSSGGSVQGVINTGAVAKLLLPIDLSKNYDVLANSIMPYYKMISKNNKEINELSSLKDFLLPLLMNGQVALRNKEKLNIE